MSLLEFRDVTRQFGGLRAIDQVSFEVRENETVGLIGPNGAGKTTLFSMASGFLAPSAGEIWFSGARIDGRPAPEICRRGLVRTFQIVRPFGEMSVLDNVMIGSFLHHRDRAEARADALAVLRRFGMAERAGQPARTLTLAGRKRLEVAKVIATRPRLLMLDEVMAGLTRVEMDEIIALIRSLRDDGVTILLVEHNMHAVMALSDRVVVIHHGRKICDAEPEVAANDPAVVEAYLGGDEE
ncbi:amino acid/amide ABC transporter ATP-binding protein 1, HAAT family [Tistlia consotensis]|uniref:Amino acid/amide ABC transporter ATP-binding protein 1, HAAT family n=1 Tax=Tistlia consotensis USBA 355 TaxID=560819 RepID=A0A1Y6B572_9PROT|nr:ABC transporter ATP-binding protein [Tistlia consotensis]SME91108.1 amino acid/amide ABC transporter ATP-binding protein 1, HAAT family [Tistlia consotensis USBA 355]SNR27120.1 amino acid/amide ABC transporter ATP-binding protein 1, HAAT family [Tistlia consotensis]